MTEFDYNLGNKNYLNPRNDSMPLKMKNKNSPSHYVSKLLFFASLISCFLILFPPYGYKYYQLEPSKSDMKKYNFLSEIHLRVIDSAIKSKISTKDLDPPEAPKIRDVKKYSWTYFSHKFLFTSELEVRIEPENGVKNFESINPKIIHLSISWTHLLAELFIVWLSAFAAFCITQFSRKNMDES